MEYVITEVWFQLISPGNGISPQNHRYRSVLMGILGGNTHTFIQEYDN